MDQLLHKPDIAKLLLRLSLGGLILLHGINKLMSISSTVNWIGALLVKQGLPELLAYGVFVGELIAPALIIIGLQTRAAALLVAVNMLFAMYLSHMGQLFKLGSGGGSAVELQLMFLLTALAIAFLGAGRYAVKN